MIQNKLRVWYFRNMPSKAKYYPVNSFDEGVDKILELVRKDMKNPLVNDNAFGLEIFDDVDQSWTEYYKEDGTDVMEVVDEKLYG